MTHSHTFTRPTLSANHLGCAWTGCTALWRLPETPTKAVETSRTSQEAARGLSGGRKAQTRQSVYEAIKAASDGLTAEKVSEITALPGDTVRPRIVELCERNLIYRSGKTRLTRSGRSAEVWCAR